MSSNQYLVLVNYKIFHLSLKNKNNLIEKK